MSTLDDFFTGDTARLSFFGLGFFRCLPYEEDSDQYSDQEKELGHAVQWGIASGRRSKRPKYIGRRQRETNRCGY